MTKLPDLQVKPFPRLEIRSPDIPGFVPWKSQTCCGSEPHDKQNSLEKWIVLYMLQEVTTVDIRDLRNIEVWECWSNPWTYTRCSRSVPGDGSLAAHIDSVYYTANSREHAERNRVKYDADICGRSPKLSIWNEGPATHSDGIIVV